jgi:hypothetical protein
VPDIYDIDYENAGVNLTPTGKRNPVRLAFLKVLLSPVVYLRGIIFDDFIKGQIRSEYTQGTNYNKGDKVNYKSEGVWECTQSHTSILTTIDKTKFINLQKYKQPVLERLQYNDSKIILTKILNDWFSYCAVPLSPIVLIRENSIYDGFWIGSDNSNTATIAIEGECEHFIGTTYATDTDIHFTVQIDTNQFNELGDNNQNRYNTLRQVIDKYLSVGFKYIIDVV